MDDEGGAEVSDENEEIEGDTAGDCVDGWRCREVETKDEPL